MNNLAEILNAKTQQKREKKMNSMINYELHKDNKGPDQLKDEGMSQIWNANRDAWK